jgi:hypothetical protein
MSMAIEKAELDRVRAIHRFLGHAAATYVPSPIGYSRWVFNDAGTQHEYTADEVRAWPDIKAKMASHLAQHDCHVLAIWHSERPWGRYEPTLGTEEGTAAIARGLCLYREMLDDEKPSTQGDEYRIKVCPTGPMRGITAWLPDEHTGPYGNPGAVSIEHSEADIAALTAALPANVAARARNVAALAAELRRPVEPRFPSVGRDDRVFGGRRW